MFLCRAPFGSAPIFRLAGSTTAPRMHRQAVQVAAYPANRRDSVAHESAKLGVRASVTSAAETTSTAAGAIDSTASVQMLSAVSRAAFTSARPAGRSTA